MDFHRLMVERRPKLTGLREGMFGRMFPDLPPLQVAPDEILAIGAEQELARHSAEVNFWLNDNGGKNPG